MSFGEILLIGVVALVVLGPERLPVVAKTLGALVGRAQRFVATVKADIQQQANLQGLESLRQDIHEAATAFKDKIENEVQGAREVLHQHEQQIQTTVAEIEATVSDSVSVNAVHVDTEGEAAHAASEVVHNDNQLDLFDSVPEHSASVATNKTISPQ